MTTRSPYPDRPDPTLRLEAVPYRAEGGYTLSGLLLALLYSLVGGLATGVLAGWIGQWFYLIVLFPIAIAFLVGFCGGLAIHWGKLRNPRLAFCVGVCGGCLAMAAMHYVTFRNFLAEADKTNPGALQLQFSPGAFGHFLDQSAVAGVQIINRPGQNQNPMNLGYYGTYIYWILEIVLVAGVAGGILASVAAAPFCSECATWKTARPLGRVRVPRAVALEAILSGEIIRLACQGLGPGPGRLSLDASVCPNCGPAAPVDISFKEVTVDNKGTETLAQLAHVTYPGQALEVLEALLDLESQRVPATPNSPPATQVTGQRPAASRHRVPLRPVESKGGDGTWGFECDEDLAVLVDAEDKVRASIPREEVAARLVFPSFWDSVTNFGVLTDEGKVVWFKPDKKAVRRIKEILKT